MIDIVKLLMDKNIEFKDSGLNIMKEHVGINCPHCKNDPSYHLNIKYNGTHAICFRCGYRTSSYRKILTDCLFMDNYSNLEDEYFLKVEEIVVPEIRTFSNEFQDLWNSFGQLPRNAKLYLEKRQIKEDFYKKLGVRFGGFFYSEGLKETLDYNWRVIFPIKDMRGTVVNFLGRHIGTSPIRYKNCDNRIALQKISECLFGLYESFYINITRILVIVEGIFDCIRLLQEGVPAVSLNKKSISSSQLELLINNVYSGIKIYICLDNDASEEDVRGLEEKLSVYFTNVQILRICGVKDIGELDVKSMKNLKKIL